MTPFEENGLRTFTHRRRLVARGSPDPALRPTEGLPPNRKIPHLLRRLKPTLRHDAYIFARR